jgi:hypothetical protein
MEDFIGQSSVSPTYMANIDLIHCGCPNATIVLILWKYMAAYKRDGEILAR